PPRFVIVLGDETGHDNTQAKDFPACPNSPTYSGGSLDPLGEGQPGPMGAKAAIKALHDANVKLSFIHYDTGATGHGTVPIACHQALAQADGGNAIASTDQGGDLAKQVETLVTASAGRGLLSVEARNATVEDPQNPASRVTFSGLPSAADLGPSGKDLPFTATVK